MPKKLSITIAGAVSLGSYESGVAFEILDAVSQHNAWAAQTNPDERIEIDVLTGASAGGMTAAMIAQRLLFDGAAMNQPYDNPLFNAWVRDVDITKLLTRDPKDEPATHSIFSSDAVIKISQAYLTARYAGNPPAPPSPHPALSTDGSLKLGLALSNLSGVDYRRPTVSGGSFIYTDHQDELLCSLQTASSDRPELWETIRAAAVACGAFPFAFRAQDLSRNIADYPGEYLVKELWNGNPARFFTYTDGGLFQNQPLGMAKNLVEQLPDGRVTALKRGYLFIAPQPKTSGQIPFTTDPNADSSHSFGSAVANYKVVLLRIMASMMGQAAFQDWITAEDVNDKLRLLDERAGELQQLYGKGVLTAAQTQPVCSAILASFFQIEAELNAARNQLRRQYASEYAGFGADSTTASAWLDSVLVLELAGQLHEKEEMLIYDFVADTTKLAGNGLEAFEGFFDVQYRKHDYDYGRTVAQQNLINYKAKGGIFADLHWTPKPIDPIDPNLDNVDMADVDEDKRKDVKSQIQCSADAFFEELGLNFAERKIVEVAFVDGQVKKLLSL
ncbi:MAG TPA: patatin-like phospholipase family protein [Bryobacteraceae bacterium]|nr:patatin-like phospholipase family protein [Bryobacteraceae bacterium]